MRSADSIKSVEAESERDSKHHFRKTVGLSAELPECHQSAKEKLRGPAGVPIHVDSKKMGAKNGKSQICQVDADGGNVKQLMHVATEAAG
jgi:hypothetical protein